MSATLRVWTPGLAKTTALVNEAYLRLADQTNPSWETRAHFFAIAARAMRQILISYARSYGAQKRGAGAEKIELNDAALVSPAQSKEIVELNEALERLTALDPRKAEVVEHRRPEQESHIACFD